MASLNEITGDLICSKSSEKYRDNYDGIFRKNDTNVTPSYIKRTETHVVDTRIVEVQPDGSILMVDPKTKQAYGVSTGEKISHGCTRSHPHENMDESCEKLTVIARDNFYKHLTELNPKCDHSYVPKLDSWCLICVKCGQQEGEN